MKKMTLFTLASIIAMPALAQEAGTPPGLDPATVAEHYKDQQKPPAAPKSKKPRHALFADPAMVEHRKNAKQQHDAVRDTRGNPMNPYAASGTAASGTAVLGAAASNTATAPLPKIKGRR